MRVTISSSSNDNIAEEYKNLSRELCEYLAKDGCDLNWGSGCNSIMGICYQEFDKYNRKMYGYTNEKYVDELKDLPNADHSIYKDTFDLKKNIFNDADFIVCLPGGTGTVSEFFAYIEEARSNDAYKEIIIYNINHHFDKMLELIDDLVDRKFNSDSIYNYLKVANTFAEFVSIYEGIKNNS